MKKQTIDVQARSSQGFEGKKKIGTVEAEVYGGLALHREFHLIKNTHKSRKQRCWRITHIKSGLGINPYISCTNWHIWTKETMRVVVAELNTLCNWDVDEETLFTQNHRKELGQRVKNIFESIADELSYLNTMKSQSID